MFNILLSIFVCAAAGVFFVWHDLCAICHCWKYTRVVDLSLQACSNVSLANVAVFGQCCPNGRDSSSKLLVLILSFVLYFCSSQIISKMLLFFYLLLLLSLFLVCLFIINNFNNINTTAGFDFVIAEIAVIVVQTNFLFYNYCFFYSQRGIDHQRSSSAGIVSSLTASRRGEQTVPIRVCCYCCYCFFLLFLFLLLLLLLMFPFLLVFLLLLLLFCIVAIVVIVDNVLLVLILLHTAKCDADDNFVYKCFQ